MSHEDTHGAFIVEKYDQDNIKWLQERPAYLAGMDAMIGKSVDAA